MKVRHESQLVAQKNPDNTKIYTHSDHLGSSTVVTNGTGDVVENTTYSPFGEVLTGGRQSRYGYEGKEHNTGIGEIPHEGLVSYYSFEGDANDETGYMDGTNYGAERAKAVVRDGYYFNQSDSDYIQIGDGDDFSTLCLEGCTISAWVYFEDSNQEAIVGRYDTSSSKKHFMLRRYKQDVAFWVGNGTDICLTYNSGDNTAAGTWYHFVGVYDGANTKTYLNGVLRDSDPCTLSMVEVTGEDTFIGTWDDDTLRDKMNGTIDEVGIWNRSLSDSEVEQLYLHGKRFDQGYRETDFHFRKYNPEWGLFTQPDTLIQDVYDPQSLNRYSFERNNPYKYIDSTGHLISEGVANIRLLLNRNERNKQGIVDTYYYDNIPTIAFGIIGGGAGAVVYEVSSDAYTVLSGFKVGWKEFWLNEEDNGIYDVPLSYAIIAAYLEASENEEIPLEGESSETDPSGTYIIEIIQNLNSNQHIETDQTKIMIASKGISTEDKKSSTNRPNTSKANTYWSGLKSWALSNLDRASDWVINTWNYAWDEKRE